MTESGARCLACGDALSSPVYRTRQPTCYVFRGAPGDSRNGLKFHTHTATRVPRDAIAVVLPADPTTYVSQDWQPPRREET